MLNIVLMGPPGAGKGTHALWIAKDYGLPHISTGDMFREAMSSGSELGNQIKAIVNSGGLVSDDLTCALVKERLSRKDCENGYLLDGFPRTIAQAEALKTFGKEINREVNTILNISCPDELLIERIAGRRVCPKCGASYNVTFMPPKSALPITTRAQPLLWNSMRVRAYSLTSMVQSEQETLRKRLSPSLRPINEHHHQIPS